MRSFSLPDWAFYPLAAMLVGGMVYGAIHAGDATLQSPAEIRANGVRYAGDDLNNLVTATGLEAQYLDTGEEAYLRITAERGPFDGPRSAGAFFALAPHEREALQGHRIRLTYTVRSSTEAGAEGSQFNFFVPGIGHDSWDRRHLDETWHEQVVELSPPSCEWHVAYAALWPDWEAGANAVDLRSVEVAALEPTSC